MEIDRKYLIYCWVQNQNFLALNNQLRLLSTKLFNLSTALALEASNIILNYLDFFLFRPNLSLCLNLRITIAAAISTIATAS